MKPITNLLKFSFAIAGLCCIAILSPAQTLIGSWQLVKQSSCLEEEMSLESDSIQEIAETMKSMSSPSAQVVSFKEKGAGEESMRILNKKRSANNKNFMYRFTGETLLILDKKSQTLTETYTVDKLSTDSLILSNSSRPC